jgi:peptidoglycan/LPS O-acetylase OafA/YrhL
MKQFRFDIGFLRVIAVISVMLYHFKIPYFDGGYSGVDVFFVISGFLMTKIILSGFETNTFCLLDFYNRRFKRIVPPLLITCFGVLVLSNALYMTNEIQQNSKNILLSSVFLSNIYYYSYTNYFAPEAQSNIFLHSWSLAVEWQFYMIYPLLLLPFRSYYNKNKKGFRFVFVSITILLFLFCFYVTARNNSFAFYMFPARAWEMLLGGVAFLLCEKVKGFYYRKVLANISYIVIILSVVFFNDTLLWPSLFTLIPVLSTFVIVLLNVNFPFLKWKPLQFVGNISYELYLWHWPVYVTFVYFDLIGGKYIMYMLFLTILISSFSYFYINSLKFIQSLKGVFALLVLVVCTSYYCFATSANVISNTISIYPIEIKKMNIKVNKYSREGRLKQFNSCNCFITTDKDCIVYNEKKCLTVDSSKKNIVLIGDSHSAQFSLSLREKISEKYNLLEVSAGMTFPFFESRGKKESVELIHKYYNFIDKNYKSIEKVFVSVHWMMKGTQGMEYTDKEIKDNILNMLAYYKKKNIQLFFIGQSEQYTKAFDKIVMLKYYNRDKEYANYIDENSFKMNTFLKLFIPKENYIDIYNLEIVKKYDENDIPYMVDNNHFTKYGADQLIDYIVKKHHLN